MSRTLRYIIVALVVTVLVAGAFTGGIVVGWFVPHKANNSALNAAPTAEPDIVQDATPLPPNQTGGDLFAPFWQAWDLVHQEYVDQPVDDVLLMQGAIRGMMTALGDQHTSYMDPNEFTQMNQQLAGNYEGIGAWVDTTGDYLMITSPMPGSPAEKAGIKSGDKIVAVDGEDVTGIDGSLVLKRVLGPAGSDVTLTIVRADAANPIDITITRAEITIPAIESKMLDDGIAYLRLYSYSDNSSEDLRNALKSLLAQNPRGLIFDLRYNGGGYVQAAVEITSQFLDGGMVLYEEYGDGTTKEFKVIAGGIATKIPMVVLVNEGSASAAEITAGALQDQGRAQLIGVTTYGKGSVQVWTPLEDEQGAVRITIAHWLTPNKNQINKIGLKPDVEVELTDADAAAKLDPQLDKAVEVLKQQIP